RGRIWRGAQWLLAFRHAGFRGGKSHILNADFPGPGCSQRGPDASTEASFGLAAAEQRRGTSSGVLNGASKFDQHADVARNGTAGWSYKDWEGVFYPAGMQHRKQHPLDLLAQCFDVVEINTSFYGHIKPHIAKLWVHRATAVNPKFMFTAKLHRSFTHNPLAV